jgi:ABC-2 type transport system ATP-binding protein
MQKLSFPLGQRQIVSMNKIIQIDNLKKSYKDIIALNNVTFSVHQGEMFGLVGPDGSGKTTLIRILCGLLHIDEGSVRIMGKDIKKERKSIQNSIGYLSQGFSLYGDLTSDENIEFFGDIHNVKDYHTRREELLEFTRLKPFRNRLADKLSGGMKQKLALACSLIHKPKIIFLDEPTRGVDPVSRRDFWKILAGLLREKMTIFMSTSYLDEAERCNRVAMLNHGEIIALDVPQEIKETMKKEVVEIICNPIRSGYLLIKDRTVFESQMFGDRIHVVLDDYQKNYPRIEKLLQENKIDILGKRIITPSLENVFMHLIK